MKAREIRIQRYTPDDLSDRPEGFEARYERRGSKQVPRRRPLLEPLPARLNMEGLLERFNLDDR